MDIVVKRSALQELCSSVLEQLSGTPDLQAVENGRWGHDQRLSA